MGEAYSSSWTSRVTKTREYCVVDARKYGKQNRKKNQMEIFQRKYLFPDPSSCPRPHATFRRSNTSRLRSFYLTNSPNHVQHTALRKITVPQRSSSRWWRFKCHESDFLHTQARLSSRPAINGRSASLNRFSDHGNASAGQNTGPLLWNTAASVPGDAISVAY